MRTKFLILSSMMLVSLTAEASDTFGMPTYSVETGSGRYDARPSGLPVYYKYQPVRDELTCDVQLRCFGSDESCDLTKFSLPEEECELIAHTKRDYDGHQFCAAWLRGPMRVTTDYPPRELPTESLACLDLQYFEVRRALASDPILENVLREHHMLPWITLVDNRQGRVSNESRLPVWLVERAWPNVIPAIVHSNGECTIQPAEQVALRLRTYVEKYGDSRRPWINDQQLAKMLVSAQTRSARDTDLTVTPVR